MLFGFMVRALGRGFGGYRVQVWSLSWGVQLFVLQSS